MPVLFADILRVFDSQDFAFEEHEAPDRISGFRCQRVRNACAIVVTDKSDRPETELLDQLKDVATEWFKAAIVLHFPFVRCAIAET